MIQAKLASRFREPGGGVGGDGESGGKESPVEN